MTKRAGSRPPRVSLASPVTQPPSVRHSARISGPPARWMAPSTPPPPSSDELAAFTMASTSCVVMSPATISITVVSLSHVHADRITRARKRMTELGVDVLLLSLGADLPYFTGYEAMP